LIHNSQVKALYDDQGGEGGGVLLNLLGSSLGGYVGARYAELYPSHINRLVAFCPGKTDRDGMASHSCAFGIDGLLCVRPLTLFMVGTPLLLLLLPPGFDLQSRWPVLFGRSVLEEWREKGYRDFPLVRKREYW